MVIDDTIKAAAQRLVKGFGPDKIILFGSRARGSADSRSDADFLVISPVRGRRRSMMVEMDRAMRGLNIARDIMILTPAEFASDKSIPGTIARSAWREGIVLYEKE
jgi:predicted nucleotidyltransferase